MQATAAPVRTASLSVSLKPGDRAPAFTLKCCDGRLISLADYAGQRQVIVFFYGKDDSPEDMRDACVFRDALDRLKAANAEVLGISTDDIYSHRVLERTHKIPYLLLADTTKAVSGSYGVLRREGYNQRATFVVDKQGLLKAILTTIRVETHIDECIKALKGSTAASTSPKS
ncbi:MAG TPA: peroxiredoxin [Planctomycetota bacterium]|nr:peroxiredoxin [Planctomycetota bacterium]